MRGSNSNTPILASEEDDCRLDAVLLERGLVRVLLGAKVPRDGRTIAARAHWWSLVGCIPGHVGSHVHVVQ